MSAATELTDCNAKKGKRRGYRPDFTHQLFEKERIEGYEDGQVTIQVLYVAASLYFWVKIETQPTDASRFVQKMLSTRRALYDHPVNAHVSVFVSSYGLCGVLAVLGS